MDGVIWIIGELDLWQLVEAIWSTGNDVLYGTERAVLGLEIHP